MLSSRNRTIGFIITSTEFSLNIFASLLSFVVLIILLYNIYRKKIRRKDRTSIKLCANIYFTIFVYSCLLISSNIQTILGDIYEKDFHSSLCIISGYLMILVIYILYMTFINQALYRLMRIVYYQKAWVEKLWLQVLLIVVEFILGCILLTPLIPWNAVVYLEYDHFCYASFTNLLGILWGAFVGYIVPFSILFMIYIFITKYLHNHRANLAMVILLQQNRDFIVIQRILVIVCLLLILGIPGMIMILLYIISGKENVLTVRISFFPVSVSVSGLTISLIFTIPQLKIIAMKFYRRNRIATVASTIPNQQRIATSGNS